LVKTKSELLFYFTETNCEAHKKRRALFWRPLFLPAKIYREGIAQSRPTAPRQWPSSAISTTRVAAGSLNEDYPKIVKNPPPFNAKVKSLLQKYDSITARVVLNLGGHCDFWRHFERHYKVKYGGDDS